ncbi:zinc transporter ZIP9-A [Lampris incognitus]|uniref:zinc transporter ZIP9-A n=1 Tax=Lampris incognitus TaxID=2546036 RepID=UPI0024B516D4|nr:zinc transporter ZIP9-A [Lampris incognitus]
MDGAVLVVCLSAAMFLGCVLLGLVPLLIKLSQRSLQYVTILGAGLLCGTALAIIIPEGVDLLESWRAPSCSVAAPSQNASETTEPPLDGGLPPRFFIGLALVVGFTFMFVADQIAGYCSVRDSQSCLSHSASITATLGLVIHAAADGFALGAAMATPDVTVQVVVFFAVILHKAPAAFGLVSFLMHAGVEKKHIQGHLLAFSAAAPILAIGTYFILDAWGGSSHSRLGATGVGMLFSAGTFLYVATVHVFPEIRSSKGRRHSHASPQLPQPTEAGADQKGHLGVLESLTLIAGVGIPVVLAIGLHD